MSVNTAGPTRLATGDRAPAFTLASDAKPRVALRDLLSARLVLYCYPADDTPGCTNEANEFNALLSEFSAAGVHVAGLSPDPVESHVRFRDKFGLAFPLLSDPTHGVMAKYGAYGEKSLYGRTVMGVIRSSFLISRSGKVERAWYHVRAGGHAARVLAEL
jgi:thioredoxin-dependent peroxiredoxin